MSWRSSKSVIVITGASQGFGRACAMAAANLAHDGSLLILLGRNVEMLIETKSMVMQQRDSLLVNVIRLDLNCVDAAAIRNEIDSALLTAGFSSSTFIVIHNAGVIGDVSRYGYDFTDGAYLDEFFRVNVSGTIIFNNVLFDAIRANASISANIMLVNVSSLAAVEPMPSLSLYCTAKAAREMFFRTFAREWPDSESRRLFVISYAPGPMHTNMVDQLLREAVDVSLRNSMQALVNKGIMLTPLDSANKLFQQVLVKSDSFTSGSRIDFYDL